MKLIDASIKYPVSVTVGVLFLVIFGILSLLRIPVQLTPDVTRPQITVTTLWPGASPQEVEREIVEEQEEYLKSVEGLTRMTSESLDSLGRVNLEFSVGTDIDVALLKVSTKLEQVPSYPPDAKRPIIVSASENAPPIAWIVVKPTRADITRIGLFRDFMEDNVKPRLERIPGIAKINVYGGRQEEMQVIFDEMAVAARKLTIAVNAIRQAGSNVLQVMAGLKGAIAEMNDGFLAEKGLRLEQVYDETEYIDSAISLVIQNIYVGGSLAIMALLLFLRSFSATLIVALAIPISVVGTFLMMVLFGRTINVISLAGCAFAAGMVVDNSIVVLENIYRHRQAGESKREAASSGTREVWGAVLASTLTTVAVFLPVIFVQEEAGQLFRDIAIAISFAVLLSMLVSVSVIPSMASRIIRTAETGRAVRKRGLVQLFGLAPWAGRVADWAAAAVYGLTGSILARIAAVVLFTFFSLGLAWFLAPKAEYLPEGNRNLVLGIMIPPPGYSIEEFVRVGEFIEGEVRKQWEAGSGDRLEGPAFSNFFYVAFGQRVFLGAVSVDPLRVKEMVPVLQKVLRKIPGMISIVTQTSLFGRTAGSGRSIDVDISGPDLERVLSLAQRVFGQVMGLVPGSQLRPIPSLDLGNPEIRVAPDRDRAAKVGLTAQEIGVNVDALLDGVKVGEVRRLGNKVDLTLMGKEETIRSPEDFQNLQLNTPLGKRVTLGSVADIELVAGPSQINHVERQRSVTIQVIPPGTMPLEEAMMIIEAGIIAPLKKSGELKQPYFISLSGTADDLTRTRRVLQGDFLLAMVITFLLMASLFGSFLYPLVIMFSVPLAAAGGFLGLFLVNRFMTYQALDVLTMLGFVILIGVVVNNAILIVHQALNSMREGGMASREAIRESVRTRMRPIFMTTFTSVAGMLPLVLFPGAGSELYRGMGSVITGGLVVSTLFTLFLVPALFSLVLDGRDAIRRRLSGD